MSLKKHIREDEKNIDFTDTRETFIDSWNTAIELRRIKSTESKIIGSVRTHQAFSEYVRNLQEEAQRCDAWRRPFLRGLLQLHQHLLDFENLLTDLCEQPPDTESFEKVQYPSSEQDHPNVEPLWGFTYLVVKFSIDSKVRVKLNSAWLLDLRRAIELLNSVVIQCREQHFSDDNNLRMQMMDIFDPLFETLRRAIDYAQSHYEDDDFQRSWTACKQEIKESIDSIFETNRHLREVITTSRSNLATQTQIAADTSSLRLRNPAAPIEKDIFPLEILPNVRTEFFVGRQHDLERIHAVLGTELDNTLKTFTIYGRRGVGKTQLALEYARTQKHHYDAIFWVQCETRAALRQSFTAIAEALELEGTTQNVNSFDENTQRVLRWLRHTDKRWLLIYDNAERESAEQLHQYLPQASKGAMLLTSRSYYNFFDDTKRNGETVQPLTVSESRELLLKHLGDDWQAQHLSKEDMMSAMEHQAIDILLEKTRGLPIAIFQAARLILSKEIGDSRTARGFLEKFHISLKNLPRRHLGRRDEYVTALDAIWAIAFEDLTTNAKTVLSILAFMSPDSILVDLFLPSDQRRLPEILNFCRSSSSEPVRQVRSIDTIVKPSEALSDSLDELMRKGLIQRNGRQVSLHRTVREGLAYANTKWFRECFAAAVSLMYDAFPQQNEGRPLNDSWSSCRTWIPHAVQLANQYSFLSKKRDDSETEAPLIGMSSQDLLVSLIANCAWYLYEVADYEECLHIIDIAKAAATDRNTITFAHLLNTEGMIYYEQNKLGKARVSMEECLAIRQQVFPGNHMEMANIYNNLCNLETAEDNLDVALAFIEKAVGIYEAIGDSAAMLLALAVIGTGRVYGLKTNYKEAYRTYQKAEALLNRKVARNPYFSASLYWTYGNLYFAQREYEAAAREYEKARQLMRPLNAVHPLVAACLYRIACTEFELDHHTKALNFLNKAYDIADVKSGGKVNGTILRILYKKSEVLQDDKFVQTGYGDGAALAENCKMQQQALANQLGIDLGPWLEKADPEESFDRLVPGYFR